MKIGKVERGGVDVVSRVWWGGIFVVGWINQGFRFEKRGNAVKVRDVS